MTRKETILIVDDMEINRLMLHELFGSDYNIIEAENGVEVMDIIHSKGDKINLILLDILMPKKDGYEVLQDMQREGYIGKIPVIVITAVDNMQSEVRALEYGASDLILKPFDPRVVKVRVENALNSYQYKKHMETTIHAQKKFINRSYTAMIDTLKMIVVHRNMESGQHIQRIQKYTKILLSEVAEQLPKYKLHKKDINIIAKAAMLHDVGKIVIPDNILNKPGRLTDEEFEIMKSHSIEGCKILYSLNQMGNREFIQCAYDICRHHHERYEGRGYPDGLKGEEISLGAQVVGIADAYDALVNKRVYKPALSHEEAMRMILEGECGIFSPELLSCFKNVGEKFRTTLQRYTELPVKGEDDLLLNNLVGLLSDDEGGWSLETDSYKYYALLQYLDASVFEADFKTFDYKQVYPTYSEFTQLKAEGNFKKDFVEFLASGVLAEKKEELLEWVHNSWEHLQKHEATSISHKYQLFSPIYQEYCWYEISFVFIEGDADNSERFLIIFKNTQEDYKDHKEEHQGSEYISGKNRDEIDLLTGVCSKKLIQSESESVLGENPEKQHTVLIISVNNFVEVNKEEGHLAGDQLVCRMAKIIKEVFYKNSIIGRVAEDDFLVFLSDISGRVFVEEKIRELLQKINIQGEKETTPLDAMIGATMYPKDGQQFVELYEKAEKALATAKKFSKKHYRIYSAKVEENIIHLEEDNEPVAVSRRMPFSSKFNNQLSAYFLSRQEEDVLPVILKMAGKYYGLSRLIAVETTGQEILYKWSAKPIRDQDIAGSQLIGKLIHAKKEFGDEGELICPDVTELKDGYGSQFSKFHISAYMMAPIIYKNEKKKNGVLILSHDDGIHEWQDEEIEAAKLIAKMIGRAMRQKAMEEELEYSHQFNQLIFHLFQSNSVRGYVVDAAYHIMEISKAMEEKFHPGAGEKCYAAFYGLAAPCKDCPLKKLSRFQTELHVEKTMMDPNNKTKVKVSALPIRGNEMAYLLVEEIERGF